MTSYSYRHDVPTHRPRLNTAIEVWSMQSGGGTTSHGELPASPASALSASVASASGSSPASAAENVHATTGISSPPPSAEEGLDGGPSIPVEPGAATPPVAPELLPAKPKLESEPPPRQALLAISANVSAAVGWNHPLAAFLRCASAIDEKLARRFREGNGMPDGEGGFVVDQ
jgi:hypothetical protein